MESGLTGDSLGGNIYKKRIGLHGRGKSGGVRTIIAYKIEDKAFFLHGFAKNERANISDAEEKALKMAAKELFQYTDKEIETALKAGALIEIVKPKSKESSEIAEKKSNGKQNPKKHT
jgi:hypothetical protein